VIDAQIKAQMIGIGDEDAVKAGFKPFPLPAPEVDEEKLEELRTMRGERRKERENR